MRLSIPLLLLSLASCGSSAQVVVTASANPEIVLSGALQQQITITLSANAFPTITGITQDQHVTFEICQPATGGPYTWTWPAVVLGGIPIGATASACSTQTFHSFDGSTLVAEPVSTLVTEPSADRDGMFVNSDGEAYLYRDWNVFDSSPRLRTDDGVLIPPGKLDIGLRTYHLVLLTPSMMREIAPKSEGVAVGLTSCDESLIMISTDQDAQDMRDSVIHEILHAITCDDGGHAKRFNSSSERKHEGIYYLSPRLTYVLVHNPALTLWLADDQIAEEWKKGNTTFDQMVPQAKNLPEHSDREKKVSSPKRP